MTTQRLSEFEPTEQAINNYFYYRDRMDGLMLQKHGNVYDVLDKDAEIVNDICEGIIIHNMLPIRKSSSPLYTHTVVTFVSIPEETLSKNLGLLLKEGFKIAII